MPIINPYLNYEFNNINQWVISIPPITSIKEVLVIINYNYVYCIHCNY